MANVAACILKLRQLGYKARMAGPLPEGATPPHEMFELFSSAEKLIVWCQGFIVTFDQLLGITISPIMPNDPLGILDFPKRNFSMHYRFENQSFFLDLEDDAFIDCVIQHIQEANKIVAALPIRLRPA